MRAERVLLAQMPMGLVQVPNLGLSLLKPGLVRADIPVDVRYFNVEFVQQFLGGEDAIRGYVRLVERQALAEICAAHFSAIRFGRDPDRDACMAAELKHASAEQHDLVDIIVRSIEPFLDYCLASVDWSQYALVGFTSLFAGMTMPSVVLAGMLKDRFPHLRIVLGGWNTGGAMGEVIAEKFGELDFILRGEADETFPKLAAAVLAGRRPDRLPGLVLRRADGSVDAIPQALVPKLDAIPFPDFDDYFATVRRGTQPERHGRSLPFESSRGCWWGEISHCKFCGLNGLSMPFRSKSPDRLVAELDHIVSRHQPSLLFAADTVLDQKYFTEVLPALRGRYPGIDFAYEIKAPVTREQMRALGHAGVTQVTVGIESLSTRILRVMGKGTSSLQNIHCLRMAAEASVGVGWQYLVGFPTERIEDYEPIVALMARLHHLSAPEQACPVTVARFSPYFEQATANQVGNLRPAREYRASYPWPIEDVARVAYHFEFDHQDGRDPAMNARITAMMSAAVADWRAHRTTARLDAYLGCAVLVIVDTRTTRRLIHILRGLAKELYQALDAPTADSSLGTWLIDRQATARVDWLAQLLALEDDRDTALLAWAADYAREIGAAIVTFSGDELIAVEPDRAGAAIGAALEQFDAVDLIASEGNKHLALAVYRQWPLTPTDEEAATVHSAIARPAVVSA
jgi:ribosomal peptide maturation radical SAM protein 1